MSEVVRSCGKFFCPEKCGKFFGTKHPIKKHLLSHRPQNEWPVVCLFCGKHFQCLNDLPKHLKTQQHINDSGIPKIGTLAWDEMLAKSVNEVWNQFSWGIIYFDKYILKRSNKSNLMSGTSRGVLIAVEYRNCRRILDVYLLFIIWMWQIQSKLIYIFVTYMDWPVCKLQVCNLVFYLICPSRIATST